MSGRCESPVLIRAGVLSRLTPNERDKVLTLVGELTFLRGKFREDPFDHKKKSYAAIHWALERCGFIEPKIEPTVFSVYEKFVGWVKGEDGEIFAGSKDEAERMRDRKRVEKPGIIFAVGPTPEPKEPEATVLPDDPLEAICPKCRIRIGLHFVGADGPVCVTGVASELVA